VGLEEQPKERLKMLMKCMRTIFYKRILRQMKAIYLTILEMLIDSLSKYFSMNSKSNFKTISDIQLIKAKNIKIIMYIIYID